MRLPPSSKHPTGRDIIYSMALAHHRPDRLDHCLLIPLGKRRIPCCARCLGLYPTLFISLALQGFFKSPAPGPTEQWLLLAGVLPALLDWGRSWLDCSRGNNLIRIITGVLLGLSLGRSFWVYLHDPRYELLWIQVGLLACGALIFELLRLGRLWR